jgi:gamma-glutamylcyclotransferase (GGCT)/AIG2-like uncharacterized protein YtfP
MSANQRLFVYGTLLRRSAHPMARFLAERARFVGEAIIAGQLFDLGRYPGLIETSEQGDRVFGDLYDLGMDAAATLAELDRYENAESPQPAYFDRQLAKVLGSDGSYVQAWVYWFRGHVKPEQRIASGRYLPIQT